MRLANGAILNCLALNQKGLNFLIGVPPCFFRIVQDTFLDDTFLHLSRLTEKPNFGKRKTPTVRSLPALISDSVLQAEIVSIRSSRTTLFQSIDVESLTDDRYSFEPLEADKDFHVPREAVGTVDSPERFLVNGKIPFSSQ